MRKPLIAANWKMHKDIEESASFAQELNLKIGKVTERDIIVFPTFTSLKSVSEALKDSNISVGAQNMHFEAQGAFTGEISTKMIQSAGCEYVLIGHSERRQLFGETDETVNKKIKIAISAGLKPMMCVGETLDERKADKTKAKIQMQIDKGLEGIEGISTLNIAYEPIWAIGTGETATPEQAEEVHKFIRSLLEKKYGNEVANNTRILYGGSVKPENAADLMKLANIDGALVGGASLKVDSFEKIVNF